MTIRIINFDTDHAGHLHRRDQITRMDLSRDDFGAIFGARAPTTTPVEWGRIANQLPAGAWEPMRLPDGKLIGLEVVE